MKDEEFEKRLETILSNLYKIDQEVKEYLKSLKAANRTVDYDCKTYLKNGDMCPYKKYDPR